MNIKLAPRSENQMTYKEAVLYCQFLEYNGHRDWRLPTYAEFCQYIMSGWNPNSSGLVWFVNDKFFDEINEWYVNPVRDI